MPDTSYEFATELPPATRRVFCSRTLNLRSIGAVAGLMHVVSVVNTSLGALAFSVGADVFGSYRSAMVAFTVWPVAVVVLAGLRPPRPRSTVV